MIGVKVTKDMFAKSVPILGGAVSRAITLISMNKMVIRLKNALYDPVVDYSINDWKKDLEQLKKEISNITDADFIDLEDEIID